MENNLSKAYTEVLLILSYMEQKYIDMIPVIYHFKIATIITTKILRKWKNY